MSAEKTRPLFPGEQTDLFRSLDNHQPELFRDDAPELDLADSLRIAVKEMLRRARNRYGLSRERIVERVNHCLPEGQQITLRQLNAWSAGSREDHPLPAWVLPALCWACRGNLSPLQLLAESLGLHLIDEQEHLAAELGKTVTEKARLSQNERLLKNLLR